MKFWQYITTLIIFIFAVQVAKGQSNGTFNNLFVQGHYHWQASKNFKLLGNDGEWSFDFNDGDGNDRWRIWDPIHRSIFTVRNNGNVGIRTNSPKQALDVRGNLRLIGDFHWYKTKNFRMMGNDGEWSFDFNDADGNDRWHVWDPVHKSILAVKNNGRVGIGLKNPQNVLDVRGDAHFSDIVAIGTINTPSLLPSGTDISNYKLFVGGGIITEEVRVETGWADYVFDKDYQLLPLEKVEAHIQEKGHLHNTPSAKEIEADNGIELGEIAVNQQEKIEEIYLHLIEMNKALKALQTENAELKAKIKALENEK